MTPLQRSVLVVGPAWVGDMVMAQSLFASLTIEAPNLAVDVVAPPGPLSLTERMPEVRDAIPLPVDHGRLALGVRWSVARRLRDRGYDRAIVLPSSFKAALLPFFAGIPVRTGYRGEWRLLVINDVRRQATFEDRANVRGYLGLATPPMATRVDELPRPALRIDPENQARLMEQLSLDEDRPVVALAPGAAYGPAKRWPAERFSALARQLADAGRSVWVLGSESDRALGEAVLEGVATGGHNLCGRTTLTDAVDLLNKAPVMVSNDSGLMHVAAAVGCHVIALFGPTSPSFAPPLTDQADIFYLGTDCSPCFARTCPLGHHRCLREISADDVFKAIALIRGTDGVT